ncbi:MAG: response regulator [Nitrospinae bacterium]|nr:response regulator [Nitrospinota bacterium]
MKPKILIIDDEKCIREPFRKFLTDDGYEVVTAINYQEAVDRIEESHFDLIFADHCCPVKIVIACSNILFFKTK